MRHEILRMLENNSRIDLHDLAIMLGTEDRDLKSWQRESQTTRK